MIRRVWTRLKKLNRKMIICRRAVGEVEIVDYRTCRLEKKASILADKDSSVTIGRSVSVEDGTLLKAFKGGKLILEGVNYINRNCSIVAKQDITIEEGVTIGPGTVIYDHDHDMQHTGEFCSSAVRIKKGAWIGANVIILKGVTIGEGSVIAAGTIVTKNIPPHTKVYDKRTQVLTAMTGNTAN